MWSSKRIGALVALLACAVALGACAGPAPDPARQAAAELERITQTRTDADVTFVRQMIPHHEQGVELADLVASRTTTLPVRDLAFRITRAQGFEIGQMQGFLTAWGTAPEPAGAGGMAGMTGMVDASRMAAIRDARGPAFDRLWLESMIAHHDGAITMAEAELRDGVHRGARNTATNVIAVQRSEIATMRGLLGLPAAPR